MTISASILQSYLDSQQFYYMKSNKHASNVFGQKNAIHYNNQPRVPFQYYVAINLNDVGSARTYVNQFFDSPTWEQVAPLIKSVTMPSMKIATDVVNQYNRKRLSQKKIEFESMKIVLHDIVDGKTLKFWDMYYRYYFADGNEPGKNIKKTPPTNTAGADRGFVNPAGADRGFVNPANALPTAVNPQAAAANVGEFDYRFPTNMVGEKSNTMNIISDTLDNQIFGYNLTTVGLVKNLINSIDIYQVHAGKFNQVTVVNPRVTAFTHDTLDYAETTRTLEVTLTMEYEYAYYTIQNMDLGGGGDNNKSSLEPFSRGEFLGAIKQPGEFSASIVDVSQTETRNMTPDQLGTTVTNLQDPVSEVRSAFSDIADIRRVSASALDGVVALTPLSPGPGAPVPVVARSFTPMANESTSGSYIDVDRVRGILQ